jgi:K+-transporting ATPase ATPase C chain
MFKVARIAALQLIVFTVLTGILYPVAVTVIAQVVFPHQANGSVIEKDGKRFGSELIGQPFDAPKYFWSRPSATGPLPYNSMASSGSNLAPTNPALMDAIRDRIERLKVADPGNTTRVPVDLVTASGSGLDPHISPAAALYQVARVARVRGLPEEKVRELVQRHTQPPTLGFLGQPRLNVLLLNMALDEMPTSEDNG